MSATVILTPYRPSRARHWPTLDVSRHLEPRAIASLLAGENEVAHLALDAVARVLEQAPDPDAFGCSDRGPMGIATLVERLADLPADRLKKMSPAFEVAGNQAVFAPEVWAAARRQISWLQHCDPITSVSRFDAFTWSRIRCGCAVEIHDDAGVHPAWRTLIEATVAAIRSARRPFESEPDLLAPAA